MKTEEIKTLEAIVKLLTVEALEKIPTLNRGGCAIYTHKVVRRLTMLYPKLIPHIKIHIYYPNYIADRRKTNSCDKKFYSCSHMWFSLYNIPINAVHYDDDDLSNVHVYNLGYMDEIRKAITVVENWNPCYDRAVNNRKLNQLIDKYLPYRND